jgi:hypothetical protein
MRIISLFLAQEDPNERNFKCPDLHGWVRERRGDMLSALWAFVKLWDESGRPDGKTLFASFPEWAKTVGGIMCAGDLGDPCLPDKRTTKDGGDEMTGDMRELFALAHEEFGDEWVSKSQIYQLLEERSDLGLFSWLDLYDKSGKTKFGKALHRYDRRVLGDVVLTIEGNKNSRRYKFLRPGDVAFASHNLAVVLEHGIEVVAPMARGESVVFIETAGVGMIGALGSVMPLAKRARAVTGFLECLRDGDFIHV